MKSSGCSQVSLADCPLHLLVWFPICWDFLSQKKRKEKETALKFLYIYLRGGTGSFWGRRKSSSLHKTDQVEEVQYTSSMNCIVAWIDLYILEIVFLSLKYYFCKADLYLWMKERENNSLLKTFWFNAVLISASPLAKHLILLVPRQYF